MINFVISNSTTVALLVIVLVIYNIYPHNPFNNSLLIALCCWIVAFGPLYWITRLLSDVITDKDLEKFVFGTFVVVKLILLIVGLLYLVRGCSQIS